MTASHDRRANRRRPRLIGLLRILLVAAVLTPVLSFTSPVAPARADALSDAIADQPRLPKLIADQNAQLAKLGKQQTSLKTQIATTQTNLSGVRVSLDESQSQAEDFDWEPFIPFQALPVIDWQNPNMRFIDLTGDGFPDLLISEDNAFSWYASLSTEGFGPEQWAPQSIDEEKGPNLIFADSTESIFLADMSGDGLVD